MDWASRFSEGTFDGFHELFAKLLSHLFPNWIPHRYCSLRLSTPTCRDRAFNTSSSISARWGLALRGSNGARSDRWETSPLLQESTCKEKNRRIAIFRADLPGIAFADSHFLASASTRMRAQRTALCKDSFINAFCAERQLGLQSTVSHANLFWYISLISDQWSIHLQCQSQFWASNGYSAVYFSCAMHGMPARFILVIIVMHIIMPLSPLLPTPCVNISTEWLADRW